MSADWVKKTMVQKKLVSSNGDTLKKLFISHASEDKESIARPLAEVLFESGFQVWFDEFSLTIGDSLREKIDEGLSLADYGIVILSPSFFAKQWTRDELDGILAVEHMRKEKVLLPIWHDIDVADIISYSPMLGGKVAVKSSEGFDKVIEAILKSINSSQAYKWKKNFDHATIYVPGTKEAADSIPDQFHYAVKSICYSRATFSLIETDLDGMYHSEADRDTPIKINMSKKPDVTWKEYLKHLAPELERLDEIDDNKNKS